MCHLLAFLMPDQIEQIRAIARESCPTPEYLAEVEAWLDSLYRMIPPWVLAEEDAKSPF